MKNLLIEKTNEEIVKYWKQGDTIFTVELGGLGPSYEQSLQNFLFDLFAYLVENKIELKKLTWRDKYSKYFDEICSKVESGKDLSGAQYGSAKSTAYQFYKFGYKEMMNKAPKDRLIQVENVEMVSKSGEQGNDD